jgi:acetyl-CoA C-acetyltransferase
MVTDELPVLVGSAQRTSRVSSAQEAPAPIDLLEEVGTAACESAGPKVLDALDTVMTLPSYWRESNQPAALAARLGVEARRTVLTGGGGEVGVAALNWLATEILHGRVGTTLFATTHNLRTIDLARREGTEPDWPLVGGYDHPERVWADRKPATHEEEDTAGITLPIHLYPIIENARRARAGMSIEEHRLAMGRLFAPFTEVAARNPHAWFPVARSAEELVTPTPTNRMICFPYTKYLNAILSVDQAAALVVTSVGEARRLGIPEDRWVYWWGGGAAVERAYPVSTRPDLAVSGAMRESHTTALANAGVGVDDLARFDLYSCFPAAVDAACEVLGLAHDDPRALTVTGGLPYAGGPGSGYTLHSLAAMTDLLRAHPDEIGMVTGNGMFLSKHSATVISARPPRAASPTAPTEQLVAGDDPLPVLRRSGRGVVASYTVEHDRDSVPVRGVVVGDFDDGARFVATLPADAESLLAFEAEERVGTAGTVIEGPGPLRFDPA